MAIERPPESRVRAFVDRVLGPLDRAVDATKAEEGRSRIAGTLFASADSVHLRVDPGRPGLFLMAARSFPPAQPTGTRIAFASESDHVYHLSFATLSLLSPEYVPAAVRTFKEACDVFHPKFALVDERKSIVKPSHFDRDLRGSAWGAAVLGPDLVRLLGRDRLLSVPAHRVEELPYGGIWVQAAENPFRTPLAAKRAIERHLELPKHFPGPGGLQIKRASNEEPEEDG